MPRKFNDNERAIIRKDLLENGSKAFGAYGFQKTTVAEIAEAAGISKGAFYRFYLSKEELFMEILENLEDRIHKEMMDEVMKSDEGAPDLLKRILKRQFESFRSEPILMIAMDGETMKRIVRKMPKERMESNMGKDVLFMEKFIANCPDAACLEKWDLKTLVGILRGLFFMSFHRDEIGERIYPDVLDFMIESAVDGLFDCGKAMRGNC